MSYGILQEYLTTLPHPLAGPSSLTGIIGTTFNGTIYLSMPILFTFLTSFLPTTYRQPVALAGTLLLATSFALASLATHIAHLIATLAVLAPLASAMLYSPTTIALGEWFAPNPKSRAAALGAVLACKNIVGSTTPFLLRLLLEKYGFRTALRIWCALTAASALPALLLIHQAPQPSPTTPRRRRAPWTFLRHKTIYIHAVAIALQSAGYGIPQTYLPAYAASTHTSVSGTTLLALFNVPGIIASFTFGWRSVSVIVPAFGSALAAFLFWGLSASASPALLVLFSLTFGFFAGGYSATWGGVLSEMERKAAEANEAVDGGLVYGLLNGARGVGYVSGGLVGLPLLKAGREMVGARFGYGTVYGPLIVFTGICSVFGGWAVLWKGRRM